MTRTVVGDINAIFGVRVYTNSVVCAPPGAELAHSDWRARLNRNLSRPSTGKWEPLTHPDPRPQVLAIGGNFIMHPLALVKLTNLAR